MSTDMYETNAWGKKSQETEFEKIKIQRNLAGDNDVSFDLQYCGICHSDIHFANNEMGNTSYPIVPGHELAGVVTAFGSNVTGIKVGDRVGVGCIVDSCNKCSQCEKGEENFCEGGFTNAFNYPLVHGGLKTNTGYSFGGYCESMTVNKRYIVKIPDNYPMEAAGPIFCSGITMYSPLAHWKALSGGMNVGIIGIGGLGQMGVRLAKAMGNKVTAISTSPNKKADAMAIGADNFIVSKDADSMASGENSLDLILNTVSAPHELSHYLPLLRKDGTLVQLGLVTANHSVNQFPFLMKRINLSGSVIGGMPETQDCMDFCAKHGIVPATKLVKADQIEEVFKSLETKNDQIVRYVLDIKASL